MPDDIETRELTNTISADGVIEEVVKRVKGDYQTQERNKGATEMPSNFIPRRGEKTNGLLLEDAAVLKHLQNKNEDSPDEREINIPGGILSLDIPEGEVLQKGQLEKHYNTLISKLEGRGMKKERLEKIIKRATDKASKEKIPFRGEKGTV